METDRITLKSLTISLAALLFVEILGGRILSGRGPHLYAALGCIRTIEILMLLVILNRFHQGTGVIYLTLSAFHKGVLRGLRWSVAIGILTGALFMILYTLNVNPLYLIRMKVPDTLDGVIALFLVGGVIGPVAEEILFRGLIYTYFRRYGVLLAILVSTLLFAFLHQSVGVPMIPILGGALFALIFEIEKNLAVPITVHLLGNCAIFLLSFIPIG